MVLLNLGCGGTRPPLPWVNVDTLVEFLGSLGKEAETALANLLAEPNYIEADLREPWVWCDGLIVDGILASHVLEHFDTQGALRILKECYRVLVPGGCLRVSVPDASYFRSVYLRDRPENWMELFGENNHVGPEQSWRTVALFFSQHLQTYAEDSLWCQLIEAGFAMHRIFTTSTDTLPKESDAAVEMATCDNRQRFSLFAEAYKERQ